MKWLASILIVPLLLLLASCGDDVTSPSTGPDALEIIQNGWQAFEAGEYRLAIRYFEDALTEDAGAVDIYNGLGWSGLRIDSLRFAEEKFLIATSAKNPAADAYVGLALCYRNKSIQNLAFAGSMARFVLDENPRYSFLHDEEINWRDLRVIAAEASYDRGNFKAAYAEVESLGGRVLDPASETFPGEVRVEILLIGAEERGDPVGIALAENWARWRSNAPRSYEYTLSISCYCYLPGPLRLTVENDDVVAMVPDHPSWSNEEEISSFFIKTIDDLFLIAADALDRASRMRFEYDPEMGYPKRLSIDWHPAFVDDEVSFYAYDLVPLG